MNKTYTKQSIKAKLSLMNNLCEEAWTIADEICNIFAPNSDDDIYELMTEIQERSRTDVDEIMEDLEKRGYFDEANIPDGLELNPVKVKVDDYHSIELSYPLKKGSLVSYITGIDPEALGSGTLYRAKNGMLVDLTYIEQKKGEIAESSGLNKDNENLDVYLYENPSAEDFTYKCSVSMADMVDICN